MGSARLSAVTPPAASRLSADPHRATGRPSAIRGWRRGAVLAGAPLLSVLVIGSAFTGTAGAAQTVQLGTATPFAVLAATAVTDIPTSSITGDVGLSPAAGTNYTGLTQAEVTGTIYSTNGTGPAGNVPDPALLTTAKNDLTTAFLTAAAQRPTTTFTSDDNQLGGQTLTAGVYAFGHAATANITAASPLVLNGEGDANAVFVFQASSDLVTAPNSVVQLINGARACNVFWEVDSSATLESSSTFVGTVMALASDTLDSEATVQGRVMAITGAVTLDANTITAPTGCAATTITPTTTPTTPTTTAGTTPTTAAPTSPTPVGTTSSGTGTISTTGSVGSGEGSTGTGSAAGTTSSSTVVPLGAPHTGLGGASHSRNDTLIGLGALAVLAAAGTTTVAGWRRRQVPDGGASPTHR
jgi:hypothetical protein